jgi:hypothetical protein
MSLPPLNVDARTLVSYSERPMQSGDWLMWRNNALRPTNIKESLIHIIGDWLKYPSDHWAETFTLTSYSSMYNIALLEEVITETYPQLLTKFLAWKLLR